MNLYQILGVSPESGEDIIKKAYRKAAKECHPDTHPGDKKAEARFKEIGEAYQILGDKQKRKKYDETILENRKQKTSENQKRNSMGADYIYPEDIKKEFDRFFFAKNQKDKKGTNLQQKVNPMDVTELFERYMGFKG